MLRAMIYAALITEDKNRKLQYVKPALAEAEFCLKKISGSKFELEHTQEIAFCNKHIANGYLTIANKEIASLNFQRSLAAFEKANSLTPGNHLVIQNLAVLNERMGNIAEAREYYTMLIADSTHVLPDHFLALSGLHDRVGSIEKSIAVLKQGNTQFPGNKDILFKLLNLYSDSADYIHIMQLVDSALDMAPDNPNLIYLAGFAYESMGNYELAKSFYVKAIQLDPNNYDGNYALGLLYLNLHLKNSRAEDLNNAKLYLLKAADIKPNAINILKSLAILYKNTGETDQLKRTNNKLNQIILNY